MKTTVKTLLKRFHHDNAHGQRIEILSTLIAELINTRFINNAKKKLRILDIGSGDLNLTVSINSKINNLSSWECLDVYQPKELVKNANFELAYHIFNGRDLPFEKDEFDVTIICDVLHHDLSNSERLLTEAKRVSSCIIIKDHFEYGWASRTMLRLMDFIGNWANDVSIPRFYFTKDTFAQLCHITKLHGIKQINSIDLYGHNWLFNCLTRAKWQFISVLK